MTALRVSLLVAGLALGLYGGLLLWEKPLEILIRIAVWTLVGVVAHDLVFAPLCAALGLAGRRIVPRRWQAPLTVAGLCAVVLAVLAVPVFAKPGMRPDNLTVLDRDYPRGLLLSLAVVVLGLLWYMLAARVLPVGQDQVVERQRTKDVEGQPPSV